MRSTSRPPTSTTRMQSAVGRWPTSANGRDLGRLGPADDGESLHFLVGFSQGWAAIRRRHLGVALAWDVNDFPYAWLWQEIGSSAFPVLRAGIDPRDRTCGELARRRPRRGDRARSGAGSGTGPATVDHRRADPLRTRRTIRRRRLDRWRGPVRIMIERSFDAAAKGVPFIDGHGEWLEPLRRPHHASCGRDPRRRAPEQLRDHGGLLPPQRRAARPAR